MLQSRMKSVGFRLENSVIKEAFQNETLGDQEELPEMTRSEAERAG